MTMKSQYETTYFFYVLGNSKLWLRKDVVKHRVDEEFINLLSKLSSNLTEGNIQLPEVVMLQKKQHYSHVRALVCKNKGNN